MDHQDHTMNKIVTIFGGSGMVGRAVTQEFAKLGYQVRVATRRPQTCYTMRSYGTPGQVMPISYDPARPDTIASAIQGAEIVVNTVGMLYERRRATFHAAHVELPRQIATACKRSNVKRFVHISALGVDTARSKYAKTKLHGEQVVRDIFPGVVILRPSVMFGPDDGFFNLFARLAQILPVLPLIGGGKTKFQPVYVGDVARAVVVAATGPADVAGNTYELGGPDQVTFRDIYARLFDVMGTRRFLMPLPFPIAKIQGRVMQMFPNPMLTVDQVVSLETDNIVGTGVKTFKDLGIVPTSMDLILPTYLSHYRAGGIFGEKQRA